MEEVECHISEAIEHVLITYSHCNKKSICGIAPLSFLPSSLSLPPFSLPPSLFFSPSQQRNSKVLFKIFSFIKKTHYNKDYKK